MKKRVVQFLGSFNQGGTERQALSLTRSLVGDGRYDVHVLTLDASGPLSDGFHSLGLREIPEYRISSFFSAGFIAQVRGCSKWLRDNRIDIVHTHDFYTNIFGMASARLAGVPVRIASKRETGGMRSAPQALVERVAYGSAQAVVVNAAAVERYLWERGIPELKIEVIYNGVNMEEFAAARRSLPSLPADRRFVTAVANLRHDVKNVPMLLEAFSMIYRRFPDVDLVVAGEGDLRPGLEARAEELGIRPRTHFIGRCDDVASLLSRSHIGVLTSDAEGFSNSILEYMAAGLPVIATDVGGAREAVVDGETGYVIPLGATDTLVEKLSILLDNDETTGRFGKNGKDRVRSHFSIERRLTATIELYERLLK